MTATPDTERLAEIITRAEIATDGPWVTGGTDRNGNRWVGNPDPEDGGPVATAGDDDAEFIAHARTDVPFLLSLVEQLQGDRDQVADLHQIRDNGFCRCGPMIWPCSTARSLGLHMSPEWHRPATRPSGEVYCPTCYAFDEVCEYTRALWPCDAAKALGLDQ